VSALALELSLTGGACCPQSWPEWAVTEDGAIVWVRADLEHRAEEIAAPALDADVDLRLVRLGREAMVLDLEDTEWSDDWLLRPAVLEADPHDAVAYAKFEVAFAPLPSEGTER